MTTLLRVCLLTVIACVVQAAEVRTLDFSLRNDRDVACEEIVRVSLPVPAGRGPGEPPHFVICGAERFPAQDRVITRHPDGSARRVMLSFPVRLEARSNRDFSWEPTAGTGVVPGPALAETADRAATIRTDLLDLQVRADSLQILGKTGTALGTIRPFGPSLTVPEKMKKVSGTFFRNCPEAGAPKRLLTPFPVRRRR